MSPSSSQAPRRNSSGASTPHSRLPSISTFPKPDHGFSTTMKSPPLTSAPITKPPPNYTLIIRLPFTRSSFVDPPPVRWDSLKDVALWQAISSGATKDLDWQALSDRFEAPLAFLLQQAAWLYGRHFEGMKAGMARLGAGSPALSQGVEGVSAVEDSKEVVTGGEAMERKGSRESHKASTYTSRKVPPLQMAEDSRPSSSIAAQSPQPGISRTPSTTTVTQSRMVGSGGSRRPSQTYSKAFQASKQYNDSIAATSHDGASESEPDDEPVRPRQLPRRSHLMKQPALGTLSSDGDAEDDEDDDSGGFLPFAAKIVDNDPTATLISPPQQASAIAMGTISRPSSKGKIKIPQPTSSSPSASSTTSSQPQANTSNRPPNSGQRAPASALSPRVKAAVSGSEGSPSMGSSFSDLDDLSVTRSALEDALLSHVGRGQGGSVLGMGMGSLVGRGRNHGSGSAG